MSESIFDVEEEVKQEGVTCIDNFGGTWRTSKSKSYGRRESRNCYSVPVSKGGGRVGAGAAGQPAGVGSNQRSMGRGHQLDR